jgi:predicted SAM-dependent methyltransferase
VSSSENSLKDGSGLRLHLGCGKRYIPGFIHVDLADFPHVEHRLDLGDLHVFADQSVELIYCAHALEYYDRVEAAALFKEWYRVLAPGGVLRLAVPDFDALSEVYRQSGALDLILGPLYGRMEISSDKSNLLYHRTVYDFRSLQRVLADAGFRNVRRYDWRNTIHKDYDDFSQAYIPHMQKDTGILISLNVEAEK